MTEAVQTKSVITRHPLISFYILAYAISWIIWSPVALSYLPGQAIPENLIAVSLLLGPVGPFIAAVVITGISEGKEQIRNLLRKLILWRVGWGWYLVAILFFLLLSILLAAVFVAFSTEITWDIYPKAVLNYLILSPIDLVVTIFIGGPLGEELGWRGFAIPRLQKRIDALPASLVHGVLWACWHLPVLGILAAGIPIAIYIVAYIFEITAVSVLMSWLLNNTRGSVLLAMIMHSAFNVGNNIFGKLGATADDGLTILIILLVAYWTVAIMVVAIYRPRHLSRDPDFEYDAIIHPT